MRSRSSRDADIARATGVARSTARAWLAHTRSPTGERAERLIELSALVERLARVMEPSYIAVWLRKPVPALGEHKPIDVIAGGITARRPVGFDARRGFFLVGRAAVAPRVQRVSVAGAWWRQAPHGAGSLCRLASPPSSGRWQHGGTVAAIYLADEEETAWAEWYRVLAEIALPPTHGMPRDLWR